MSVCVWKITGYRDVYICMCVSSQQNSIETHNLSFLKNLSEDVIILSMPNTADDTGIVAVFLFGYVGDEIYMNIYIYIYMYCTRVSSDTLLFAAAHCAFTSAAAV